MKASIYLTILSFFFASAFLYGQDNNQLVNPGFEQKSEGWTFWGGEQSSTAHAGSFGLKISQEAPKWSGAHQVIRFPKSTSTVEVKGWMKAENVIKGENSWEVARIGVEFLDDEGNMVGGHMPVVGSAEGTTDWELLENTYDVPDGATQIKVQAALGNCTGTAFYDDMSLVLKGSDGGFLNSAKASGPADWGTWYTIPTEPAKTGSHYVDWSSLLDKPAGKHGFAKVTNGKIVFTDGTPVRFWGTNLMAGKNFLEKKQADSLATRLSKMGCNLLRLHHMDAPWAQPNIFGNGTNTKQLAAKSLDKLDYLISALKKKGIYIFLDLLVHRDFTPEDGVMNKPPDLGGKQIGYFDDKIIQLQKEYIKQLLNHKNVYTGLAYKDEPAIVASEFINESSAYVHFTGDILTDHYRQELNEKFEEDSTNAGKKLTVFDVDYSTFIGPSLKTRSGKRGDVAASFKFISKIEKNYYKGMSDYMRSLGVKYILSGSNYPNPILAYQRDNTIMELITTNDYWDHPKVWEINNEWDRVEYAPFNNTSLLKNYIKGPINNLSKYKWKDKPMIVTEYNVCYPNEYRLEGVPVIAAYSRLQGWDGMLQFHFDPEVVGTDRHINYTVNNMPEHLANWVMAAPLFLRGDVAEAPSFVADNVTDKQAYSLPSYSDFIDKNSFLPLVTKVGKQTVAIEGEASTEAFAKYYNEAKQTITSETGELSLNHKRGVFKINTPKVQGVLGTLKDSTFKFPFMTVSLRNPWASAFIISKENKPLPESKTCYLVVTTPVKAKGMQYSNTRTALKNIGEYVMQAQNAMGSVTFTQEGKKYKVYPLSMSGVRDAEIPLTGNKLDLTSQKTFVFEIVVE